MKNELIELADEIQQEMRDQGCFLDYEECLILAEVELMYNKANHMGVERVH